MGFDFRAGDIAADKRVARHPVEWDVYTVDGTRVLGTVKAVRLCNARKMAAKRYPGYGFVQLRSAANTRGVRL